MKSSFPLILNAELLWQRFGKYLPLFVLVFSLWITYLIWAMVQPEHEQALRLGESRIVAVSGVLTSLMLALISWLLMRVQHRSEQLFAMESSYSTLFNNTLDASLLLHGNNIINCNNMATTLLGCPRSEIIGRLLTDFAPPTQPDGSASQAKAEQKFRATQAGGEAEVFEWQIRRQDGTLIFCDAALRATRIGRQGRAFVSLRDISARKRNEMTQLHSILSASPDAVLMVNDNGTICFANHVAVSMFGYPMEQLIGLGVDELVPAESRAAHAAMRSDFQSTSRSRAMAQGQALHAVNRDGTEFPVEISLTPIRISDQKRVIAIVHDISQRKRVEAELVDSLEESRNAHQRLSLQFNRMPLAYIVWNRDFIVTEWNPAAEQMFGWPASDAVGQHAYELVVPASAQEQVHSVWMRVLGGGDMLMHSINENVTRSGRRITCEWFNTPLLNEQGEVYGCMSMVSDITQRKQSEDALIELNERLELRVAERTQELAYSKEMAEAASHAKSEFLANMSHEIRTPMNSVLGMAYLALQTDLTPKQRDYLEKIHHSGEHLLGIINDILDFSKIEAGKLTMEAIDFSVDSVFRKLSTLVADKAHAKGLALSYEIDPAIVPCMRGDPLRLSQVLLNYLNNAIKFTQRGEIVVRARMDSDAGNSFLLRFEVQDTGIGMSQDEVDKLFQPFHQADSSVTRRFGGTGLGLAISKRLASMMGGEVGVSSHPGTGSLFWVTARFELCNAPACCLTDLPNPDQVIPEGQPARAALMGARVLLADDNLFNQQVACELLQEAGVQVSTASNGQEVLDLLRKQRFDCVLMDVQMPVMDGLEATRRIRSDAALSNLPVLAMTANARAEDKEQCFASGMDDFLIKPLLPDLLYATVGKWVRRSPQPPARSIPVRPAPTPAPRHTSRMQLEHRLAGDPEVIDLSVLAQMVNDDPKKIRKFAAKFLETADKGMTEIVTALDQADFLTLAAVGHRIKAAARTVGAMGFADLCQELEQHENDLARSSELVSQQQALLELIRARIATQLAGAESLDSM
ncbi:MAG TPA: PAS domain S-box protein [Gallionellaceae bacterium]